ncbi:MAG: thiamine pyrophosphate-binding protein [Nitrospirae bacterium]|nr:thiamine pyrophosphate-binding protein [Nitrospirota bacterium]
MTAAEAIVHSLERHGVEYVFGVPGGAIEPLNSALYKSSIRVIVTKHEEGAAFMADGYARVSGKLGVCCGTSGPGATNLVTGIASSNADSIPVMALTGQVATSVFGKGAVQEFSVQSFGIVSMFRQITKYSDIIINEKKAGEMIAKARRIALTGRKGAVHLNLPTDIMKLKVTEMDRICSTTQVMGFDRERVKEAAQLLLKAKRPVIIAGWGTALSRAHIELLELAEMMNIPVATSPKGKGIMNELHRLSLGVLGFAGSSAAQEYIIKKDVDVMLAVGTSFNEWMTTGWDKRLCPTKAMIQIDMDYDEIGKNYYVDVGIVGDAKTVLRELIFELRRQSDEGVAGGVNRTTSLKVPEERSVKKTGRLGGRPCKPQRLIMDLVASLPKDVVYFVDNGSSMAWAIRHIPISVPYSFYVGLGFASMGFAVAAAIGGKLAAGERPVVALVGDGSFLMNGMEVATAVNYNIPVIWVVMNNSMLGMVYHARKLAAIPEGIISTFRRVDFVKLAEGLGARGIRITKPGEINRKMMDKIISSGRPTVLDVIIDPEEVPPIHSRISSLERTYN